MLNYMHVICRDKIDNSIREICVNTEKWLKTERNLDAVMDGLAKGSQQLEVLKAAAAHPQHHLYSLHSRYQSRKNASEAMINAQIGLKQKLEECDKQLAQYKVIIIYSFQLCEPVFQLIILKFFYQMMFYHLRGEQFSQWLSDLNNRKDYKLELFDVITDFLKSTGMNQLVNQVCLYKL